MKIAALFLASLLLAGGANAQPYPSRPIRFVVPFPPGGGIASQAIVHHMIPKRPFDMQRDFAPVKDFMALAKANIKVE